MNDTTFDVRIRETMSRLHFDEVQAAAYLGVPVFTLRKWATGERHPGAAVIRLLDKSNPVGYISCRKIRFVRLNRFDS